MRDSLERNNSILYIVNLCVLYSFQFRINGIPSEGILYWNALYHCLNYGVKIFIEVLRIIRPSLEQLSIIKSMIVN